MTFHRGTEEEIWHHDELGDCVEYYNTDRLHFSLDADNEMLLTVFHSRKTADETGSRTPDGWMPTSMASSQNRERRGSWTLQSVLRLRKRNIPNRHE